MIAHPSTQQLSSSGLSASAADITGEQIQAWMITYLASLLEISEQDIEIDVPFDSYGLDSSAAIGLTGDLEDWLGQEVDPTLLYDYPTVEALVAYLSDPIQA
ncbi:MAG: acyl carrier protein [Phormidesmis sp. RL_2_1]|nr:acyl carrier protein [Phormidesmis sp. RL_2_1]